MSPLGELYRDQLDDMLDYLINRYHSRAWNEWPQPCSECPHVAALARETAMATISKRDIERAERDAADQVFFALEKLSDASRKRVIMLLALRYKMHLTLDES